jgi:ABC-type sulfate transport system permease subunit
MFRDRTESTLETLQVVWLTVNAQCINISVKLVVCLCLYFYVFRRADPGEYLFKIKIYLPEKLKSVIKQNK